MRRAAASRRAVVAAAAFGDPRAAAPRTTSPCRSSSTGRGRPRTTSSASRTVLGLRPRRHAPRPRDPSSQEPHARRRAVEVGSDVVRERCLQPLPLPHLPSAAAGPGPGRDRRDFVRIRRQDGEGGELPPRGRARARPRAAQRREPEEDDPIAQSSGGATLRSSRPPGAGASRGAAARRVPRHARQDDRLRRRGDHAPLRAPHPGRRAGARVPRAAEVPRLWAEDLEKPGAARGPARHRRRPHRHALHAPQEARLGPHPGHRDASPRRRSARASASPRTRSATRSASSRARRSWTSSPSRSALRILPIPGDPAFQGPVGRFDLTAKLDRAKVAPGEAVTLRIRLSGTGNLRTATESPKLDVANATLYPPSVKSDSSRTGHTQVATEWSYVLVPKENGTVTIPPVSLAVFDPAEKRIVTKTTAPLTLVAEGGASGGAAARPHDRRDDAARSRPPRDRRPLRAARGPGSSPPSTSRTTPSRFRSGPSPRCREPRSSGSARSSPSGGAGPTARGAKASSPSPVRRRSARPRAWTGRSARSSRAGTSSRKGRPRRRPLRSRRTGRPGRANRRREGRSFPTSTSSASRPSSATTTRRSPRCARAPPASSPASPERVRRVREPRA